MRLILSAFAIVALGLLPTMASADEACMKKFAEDAKAKGIEAQMFKTEEVWIQAASAEPLRAHTVEMTKCLDVAYANKATVKMGAETVFLWNTQNGGTYDWCVSNALDPQPVGGDGPGKDQFVALFICQRGQSALPTCAPGVAACSKP